MAEYAIFMLDLAGRVETWNVDAARIKGYSADEIIGRHFSVFYLDDEARAGKPDRKLADALVCGQVRDEGWRVRNDGSRFWASVVITPLFGASGALRGFAKITRDDTDRKTVDEQTREIEVVHLCEVCVDVAALSGASIMLMCGDLPGFSVASNEVSALIEELQYISGEGPSLNAYLQDRPVLEPDLVGLVTRWFAFTPPAVEAGVQAIFSFPLQVATARLGALTLYRDRPGPLSDDQYAEVLVLADVAAQSIVAMQAQTPPGALAPVLEDGANCRPVAHQASGIVAVQFGISVGEALLRLPRLRPCQRPPAHRGGRRGRRPSTAPRLTQATSRRSQKLGLCELGLEPCGSCASWE